jgi:hypothetical protein
VLARLDLHRDVAQDLGRELAVGERHVGGPDLAAEPGRGTDVLAVLFPRGVQDVVDALHVAGEQLQLQAAGNHRGQGAEEPGSQGGDAQHRAERHVPG